MADCNYNAEKDRDKKDSDDDWVEEGYKRTKNEFHLIEWHKRYKQKIRKLEVELRVETSRGRQIKRQIRINYEWDGEDTSATSF